MLVPPGNFLTGGLRLLSNVQLYLDAGAVLTGSTQPADYPDNGYVDPPTPAQSKRPRWMALIFARGETNVSIDGPGTIEGQGEALANNVSQRITGHPGRVGEAERPQILYLRECKTVAVRHVTLQHAACWVETYEQCDGVTIEDLKVDSDTFWNNDGIDVVDCRNVLIQRCDINTADDGICLKSQEPAGMNENITISRCKVRSAANGFKIGTATAGTFRHIRVDSLNVYNTLLCAVSLECVDGGSLSDLTIDGLTAEHTGGALFICLHQRNRPVGQIRDIILRNFKVTVPRTRPDEGYKILYHYGDKRNLLPASITGLPDHRVENVTLENFQVVTAGGGTPAAAKGNGTVPENPGAYPDLTMFGDLPAWGLYARHVKNLTLNNVDFRAVAGDFRPALVTDDVEGLKPDGVAAKYTDKP